MDNCIEVNRYVVVFTHSKGNGWAIVNAMSVDGAQKVFINQTKFINPKIKGVTELRYFGDNVEVVYEGGLNVLEKAIPEIVKEFDGSFEELRKEIKDLDNKVQKEIEDVINSIPDAYTKDEVYNKNEINSSLGELAQTSKSYTDSKVRGKADKTELPTKVSQLENDSNFVNSSGLNQAVTTLNNSINNKQIKDYHGSINYNSITQEYSIDESIANNVAAAINEGRHAYLSVYVDIDTTDEVEVFKSDSGIEYTGFGKYKKVYYLIWDIGNLSVTDRFATVATTGSFNDLKNKPSIPSKVSELENDAEYATEQYVDNIVGDINVALGAIIGE